MGVRIGFKTTRRIEPCDKLIGERFVFGRSNGLFVKAHRVNVAAFDASDLRANQCCPVFEILQAALRPSPELRMVGGARAST